MAMVRFQSKVEQVAAHLRGELMRGRWGSEIPGRNHLAAELGTNAKTVEAALRLMEQENLLIPQGAGRRRRIAVSESSPSLLRIAVLTYEPAGHGDNYMIDLLHLLAEAGHIAFWAGKTLTELGMNVHRVARMVEETKADAWVVVSGSREVLGWFATQGLPVMALFGRRRGLPIAGVGPDKPPVMEELAKRLIELGHRRIVMLARAERRVPEPGATERALLGTLAAHGLETGSYHLPDWDETVDGFHRCLEKLFRLTPPTALIVDEAPHFTGAAQFCARHGIRVPEDVSLICCDSNPHFAWCKPQVAHIGWDSRPVVRRIVRWAANLSRGIDDRRQSHTAAAFIEGGTIGPAKR
jgi:hypothetical protein